MLATETSGCERGLCAYNPSSSEADRRIYGARWPPRQVYLASSRPLRGTLSQNIRWMAPEEGSQGSASICVCTNTCTCTSNQKKRVLVDIVVQEVALEPWHCVPWVPRFPLGPNWPVMQGIWAVVTASTCPTCPAMSGRRGTWYPPAVWAQA